MIFSLERAVLLLKTVICLQLLFRGFFFTYSVFSAKITKRHFISMIFKYTPMMNIVHKLSFVYNPLNFFLSIEYACIFRLSRSLRIIRNVRMMSWNRGVTGWDGREWILSNSQETTWKMDVTQVCSLLPKRLISVEIEFFHAYRLNTAQQCYCNIKLFYSKFWQTRILNKKFEFWSKYLYQLCKKHFGSRFETLPKQNKSWM